MVEVVETKLEREFETSDEVRVEVEFDVGIDAPVGVMTIKAGVEVEELEEVKVAPEVVAEKGVEDSDGTERLVEIDDEESDNGFEVELNSG